jgi:FixJ family two-component response regulator
MTVLEMLVIQQPRVIVVDDQPEIHTLLRQWLQSVSLSMESFTTAQAFLEAHGFDGPGCLLLDVRLPDSSGLEVLEYLARQPHCLSVVVMTGYGDVPMAVRAMQAGASDFLEKPLNAQVLLECVLRALKESAQRHQRHLERSAFAARHARLTRREREVLELLVTGNTSKVIASRLGISRKTLHIHRANVLKKLEVANLVELVRATLLAGPPPDPAG